MNTDAHCELSRPFDGQDEHKTISARLRFAGITPTRQRLRIACAVLTRPRHFSAEQIFAQINAQGLAVSKATVYNTLGLFAKQGLIREVLVDPDRLLYDSNTDQHCHIYHEDSGELIDVSTQGLRFEALPDLPEGSELAGIDIIIRVHQPR